MRGLTCVVMVLALTRIAAAQFRPFALHGDPIPGTNDTIDRVSAAAALGANNVAYVASGNLGRYLVVDIAGADTVIATQGALAPDGLTFGPFDNLRAWGSQVSFTSNATTYLWSAQSGVRALAVSGLVAANPAGQTLHLTSTLTFVDTGGAQTVIAALNGPVPGDPTFTIESIEEIYLHDNGDIAFQVRAANASRSIFRSYIFQGPPSAPAVRESSNTLPPLGEQQVRLLGATSQGDLAWVAYFSTDAPTTTHAVFKLRRNGVNSQIAEQLDGAPIMISGLPFTPDTSTVNKRNTLTATQLVMYAASTSGQFSSVIRYANGAWQKVLVETETLPGATSPGATITSVVGDRILLDGTAGVWTWTNGTIQTVALAGQTFGSLTAQDVAPFAANEADDGIIVGVAHPGSSGGTRISGFITGTSSRQADLEIVDLTGKRGRWSISGLGSFDAFFLTVTVRNNGPNADHFVLTGEVDVGVPVVKVADGDEADLLICQPIDVNGVVPGACSSTSELAPGEERTVTLVFERGDDGTATVFVAPKTLGDPDLENSQRSIVLRESSGGCSATPGRAPIGLVGIVLLVFRRRRSRAVWG